MKKQIPVYNETKADIDGRTFSHVIEYLTHLKEIHGDRELNLISEFDGDDQYPTIQFITYRDETSHEEATRLANAERHEKLRRLQYEQMKKEFEK